MLGISKYELEKLTLPLPSLAEQREIVGCLSSLDDLIEAREGQVAALKLHKRGLMQRLFPAPGETTPALRFPGFRDAPPWEVKRLGEHDVAKFIRDRIPSEKIPPGNYVSTVNLLPDFGGLSPVPEVPPSNAAIAYREGDILMSNIRPYLKKVWIADRSGGTSNDVFVVRSGRDVMHQYLGQFLMSDRFIAHVMSGAKGSKMPRGDLKQIQDFLVPLPSLAEQREIVGCLSSLDDLIEAREGQVATLKLYKRGLMQKLFPAPGETVPRLRGAERTTEAGV
ncbi:MAG: restriction endonuclease subunit S [Hyphomonadaceae bacterium]|nr:restriction endonuclease subunit S [Hyphomonadaceae bacterium]MBC6413009.1 restriction endonuclease subunit S [Hyphomonadaceae bacterium]